MMLMTPPVHEHDHARVAVDEDVVVIDRIAVLPAAVTGIFQPIIT